MVVYINNSFCVFKNVFQISATGAVGTFQQNNGVKFRICRQFVYMYVLQTGQKLQIIANGGGGVSVRLFA